MALAGFAVLAGRSLAVDAALTAAAVAQVASMTLVRDALRDAALARVGLDVWARVESPNWSVIAIFLAVFILGLVGAGWLTWVAWQTQPSEPAEPATA